MFRKKWKSRETEDAVRVIKDPVRSRERTMNRAVKLLAAKPRSVAELRERLLEKLWTDEAIVDGVLEKLKEYKYLDDAQYARDLAVSKLRQKPQGKRKLHFSLSQKKLDKEIVEGAIEAAYEKMPEAELIDIAIQKRIRLKGMPDTRDELKKFYDHMMRQGFSYGQVRDKMRELPPTEADGED